MILDSPIVTGSVYLSGSFTITGGNVIGNLIGTASRATTSSHALTASYVGNAVSASYALSASYIGNVVSASYAQTASFTHTVQTAQTASAVTVIDTTTGIPPYYPVFVDGTSTRILRLDSTGYSYNPSINTLYVTSSLALTSSLSDKAISASNAATASTAITASFALTASYIQNAISASAAIQALSASYAVTASYADVAGIISLAPLINNNADNRILTATGGANINAESTLTFDGTVVNMVGVKLQQGSSNNAIGINSHAQGLSTTASGSYSHAEGFTTIASGPYSHAEGDQTIARGYASHTEGWGTVTSGSYQHVQGQYNISSSAQSAFIIGNGTADGSRSNLVFTSGSTFQITGSLDVNGSARVTNGLTVTGSSILDGVVNLGTTSSTIGELVVYGNNSTLLLTRGNGDSTIRLNTGDTTSGSSGSLYVLSNQFFEISTSNRLKLATGNKERITIQNDGGIIINSGSQATAPTVLQVTGSVSISDILTLTRRTTTPTPVEGMIIASGSTGASILYYYNGTTWNALF